MFGPIFERELATLPRRGRFYLARVLFAGVLLVLLTTAWLLLAGIQTVRNTGDFARFSAVVFQIIGPFQLLILTCLAALVGTIGIAHEKDRKTLLLLLMTDLTNREIVGGKLGGAYLQAINLALAGLPVPAMLTLLGGVSLPQVAQLAALTLTTIAAATALGVLIAAWREKTFQAIAATILVIVLWVVVWELGHATGYVPTSIAAVANPLRAVWELSAPLPSLGSQIAGVPAALVCSAAMAALAIALTMWAVVKLRVWNPSREARPGPPPAEFSDETAVTAAEVASSPTDGHSGSLVASPDGRRPVKFWRARPARRVWNNPVLWREVRTWAYGKKILLVRAGYLLLFAVVAAALWQMGVAEPRPDGAEEAILPPSAKLFVPFAVMSLIMLNALAVNSITNERDAQALDLLLVTEITPPAFLLGKVAGVFYVGKEMVLCPLLLTGLMYWQGLIGAENLIFLLGGLLVIDLFVTMLGVHCGIIYYRSRTAISTSLGTAFFLFVGIAVCMLIMISFRGSFSRQLPPFLAIILGGGTGLYYALGARNPSAAIMTAAFGLPFLTFFCITSFILGNQELTVFAVIVVTYGFATAAMAIPALTEFDFALGRVRIADEAEG